MVCTTKDLLEWNNFPKGLKVLVLAKDTHSSSEITSKLQEMDYIVSTFHREDEALSTVLDKFEAFHVAIVEVSTIDNNNGSFKFLKMTKGLPTIIVADDAQCLNTSMKCIALGAVEVLNKPLCDDKLRNIWQHVVHKAYNAGDSVLPEPPTPVSNSTILTVNEEMQCLYAPSTPQLRTQDDAGRNDRNKSENDSAEHYQESKSAETTCSNLASDIVLNATQHVRDSVIIIEENDSKASERCGPCGPKTYRRKMKVDWTSDLHKKFIQAVEQLGIDQAIPSRILELMNVNGLTRHNVASHLQKYRMQRRHTLPKRDEKRGSLNSSYSIMTFRPHTGYPMWIQSGSHAAGFQHWPWKSYATMQAEVWGCPVIPSLQSSYYPQNMSGSYSNMVTNGHFFPPSFSNDHLADEVIDNMIKEAINKPPWVPLPIGLKPPSTESVLFELHKQGISNIPPN